jgi:hypothetical protein
MRRLALTFALATLAVSPQAARAQGPPPQWLTVFLDCRTFGCDRNFLITELPFVLWTQDRLDAEVHALITGLSTGSGGRELTIELIGQRRFAGRVDTLTATLPPNTTDDGARRELTRVLKVGLASYALRTLAGARLSLDYDAPEGGEAQVPSEAVDPWNYWVYRVRGSGDVGAESQSQDYSIDGSASARRITERWKIGVEADYEYNALAFEPDSGPTERFAIREASLDAYAVRSLTQHWSVATAASTSVDEFRNQDFTAEFMIGAEWNYFPWREATSRQLVAIVGLEARHFDYSERTIYDRLSETRAVAVIQLAAQSRQPWGSLDAGLEHTRYLHDANIYSVSAYSFVDVRLSRGLSINFGASAGKVNDQLYLSAGGLTPGQILTRQRALRTAYRIDFSAGLSYTFGSILNTIVNPRFDNY